MVRTLAFLVLAGCALELDDPDTSTAVAELNGDTWVTVEDRPRAWYQDIAVSPAGRLFAVGNDSSSPPYLRWLVRRSDDGTTWTTADTYQLSAGGSSEAIAVDVDAQGRVFVAGWGIVGGKTHWIVRRSVNAGVSWTTVDDHVIGPDSAMATSVLAAADGKLYAGGGRSKGMIGFWMVRRSLDNGTTWSDFDVVTGNKGPVPLNHLAFGMCAAGATLYAAGGRATNPTNYDMNWVTRRATSSTWSTVDNFAAGGFGGATGCAGMSNGTVFVSGTDATTPFTSVVRRSTNGTTWTTVDSFTFNNGGLADVGFGAPGIIYGVGSGGNGTASYWRVRRSTDGGTTWVDSDEYALGAINLLAGARGLAYSTLHGSTFVAGDAQDDMGTFHGVVRRLTY